jgi:hypothetical protein
LLPEALLFLEKKKQKNFILWNAAYGGAVASDADMRDAHLHVAFPIRPGPFA